MKKWGIVWFTLATAVLAVSLTSAAASARNPQAKPRCKPGMRLEMRTSTVAYGAVVRRQTRAYRTPNGRGLISQFGPINANGYPTVFGVLAAVLGRKCQALWYQVQLPMRPNGVTGYIRAFSVRLEPTKTRIVVDLSSRRVLLYQGRRIALSAVTAIGASATPTPLGHYYVNQRLIPSYRNGPFGDGALGISAFSEVHRNWAQGGPVAIHGTNQPWLLGQRVSNGCIRVSNAVIRRLFALAPAGTPVQIRL